MGEEKKEEPSLGGLQPEIVKKPQHPKVVKCPKCGSTAFDLKKTIEVVDMLSFDDDTGQPFITLMNMNEYDPNYIPHKQCDKIECSECGTEIPKEAFIDLPDDIETELNE